MRAGILIFFALAAWGHDAPPQVRTHIHLRTVSSSMRALVRIPLEAVRDVAFPAIEGGYLDVEKTAPLLPGLAKIWVADWLTLYENGVPAGAPRVVATQVSILSDRSFGTFDSAAARLHSPRPGNNERLFWKQVFFDMELEYAIHDANAAFAIKPAFANLGERVDTVVHFRDRTFLVAGDQEAFPLDPSWLQAAWLFIRLGFIHILDGLDHLLFLLCLVIPNRRLVALIGVATAFTAAHSLTLIASAFGMTLDALWFPPFVEVVIAASIVYMALANIIGGGGHGSWILAFCFGLVHGFGFSFALRESMQFAGSHLLTALLSFNIGVEFGQLFALALMVPAVAALFRYVVAERMGTIIVSAFIAHTGWHWMWERADQLRKYTFTGPVINAGFVAMTLRWLMVIMVIYGVYWLIQRRWRSS